jgi:uncharacterized protein with FMN-binding domain
VRNLTKSIFGVVSLGVLASSYSIGLANQAPVALTTKPSAEPSNVSPMPTFSAPEHEEEEYDEEEGDDEEEGESLEPAPAASAVTPTQTPKPTPTKSSAPSKVATPTKSATPSPTKPPASTPAPTQAGAAGVGDQIFYKYGSIQLRVAKSGGALSEVKILKATVRGSEWASVPDQLAAAAVAANGTGFANVSGATFTSNAFRSALESALAKL